MHFGKIPAQPHFWPPHSMVTVTVSMCFGTNLILFGQAPIFPCVSLFSKEKCLYVHTGLFKSNLCIQYIRKRKERKMLRILRGHIWPTL